MGLSFSWSVDDMMRGILNLLAEEPPGTQYVRPIAFRGAPELWVTGSKGRPVDVAIFTVRTEDQRNIDEAMSCIISPVERISSRSFPSQTKVSGSYVNSFLARSHAESMGYQDGIMLDRNGLIAEASAANVFFIKDNHLITPSPNPDIFPGITRLTVIEIAKLNGIPLVERPLREADIGDVEGAFLCSTLMEIRSISDIGSRKLQTESSEVFRSVVRSFRKQTQS